MSALPTPAVAQDSQDEELEDVPDIEKAKDALMNVRVLRKAGAQSFPGKVEDIEQGKVSKDRLYRIRYDDGDLEHLTSDQVQEFKVEDPPPAAKGAAVPKGKAKAKAKAAAAKDVEAEDEDEAPTIVKRPAAAVVDEVEEEEEEEEQEEVTVEASRSLKRPAASLAPEVEAEDEEEEEADEEDEVALPVSKKPARETAEDTVVLKRPSAAKADEEVEDEEDAVAEAEEDEDEDEEEEEEDEEDEEADEEEAPVMKKPAAATTVQKTIAKGKAEPKTQGKAAAKTVVLKKPASRLSR